LDVSVFDWEKDPKSYAELPITASPVEGWGDSTDKLSLSGTPCFGGKYFQSPKREAIQDGLVVAVTFTGDGTNGVTLCGMSEVVGIDAKNAGEDRSGGWANTTRGLPVDGFTLAAVINVTASGGGFEFKMNMLCQTFSASTLGTVYSFPQALSSTFHNKFTHGICIKDHVSASVRVLSRDDKLYLGNFKYGNVSLPVGSSTPVQGWTDGTSRVIGGFQNSPCDGGTYMQPWHRENVFSGTSFRIKVTGSGTFCAISEIPGGTIAGANSNTDRSGGWSDNSTGLVAQYGLLHTRHCTTERPLVVPTIQ
jgi:hypothetical protein